MEKGQVAMEYLIITAFSLIFLLILINTAYTRMYASEKEADLDAAERAVNSLKEAADFVYIQGHPTKITRFVYVPKDSDPSNSYVTNNIINLAMRTTGDSHTDVWRRTRGDVAGSLPAREGYYLIIVESTMNGTISIHEKE